MDNLTQVASANNASTGLSAPFSARPRPATGTSLTAYTLTSQTRFGARYHTVTTPDAHFAHRLYEQALIVDNEPEHTRTRKLHCIEFVATDADCHNAIAAAQGASLEVTHA